MPSQEIGVDVIEFRALVKEDFTSKLELAKRTVAGFKGAAVSAGRAIENSIGATTRAAVQTMNRIPIVGSLMRGGGGASRGIHGFMTRPVSELGVVGLGTRAVVGVSLKGILDDILETDRFLYDAIKIGFDRTEMLAKMSQVISRETGKSFEDLGLNIDTVLGSMAKLATSGVQNLDTAAELATTIALVDRNFKGTRGTLEAFTTQMYLLNIEQEDIKALMLGGARAANIMKRDYDTLLGPIAGMTEFLRTIDQTTRAGMVRQLIQSGGFLTQVMGDPSTALSLYHQLRAVGTPGGLGLRAFLGRGGVGTGAIERMLATGDLINLTRSLVTIAAKMDPRPWRRIPEEMQQTYGISSSTFFLLRQAAKKVALMDRLGTGFRARLSKEDIQTLRGRQAALGETITGALVAIRDEIRPMIKGIAMWAMKIVPPVAGAIVKIIDFFKRGLSFFTNLGDISIKDLINPWGLFGDASGGLVAKNDLRRTSETQPEIVLPLERIMPFMQSVMNVGGEGGREGLTVAKEILREMRRMRSSLERSHSDPFAQAGLAT